MLKRVVILSSIAAVVALSLSGCDRLRHDVTLAGVWDTEAPTILTSQEDVTAEVCGVSSKCVEALRSDQAMAFKFASEQDLGAEVQAGDVVIRGIFIIRWTAEVPREDREYVESMLDHAGRF